MATKKLTIKGGSVDYAIRVGLSKIGLTQEQTHIKILQRDTQSIFGHKDAIIAILYDDEESAQVRGDKHDREFRSKFLFRHHDGEAQVRVGACFYDKQHLPDKEARKEWLLQYLKEHEVEDPGDELVETIADDFQCQYDFYPVKALDTIPLNDLDSSIVLNVSDDKMLCRAIVFGSQNTNEEEVFKVLKQHQIFKGVLRKNLHCALSQETATLFDLARGVEAVDDAPGEVEKFFQEDEQTEFANMMELLTIDTRQVKDINIAERNQLLMHIGDVVVGKDGFTIDGTILSKKALAQADNDNSPRFGQRVRVSEDGKEVYAKEAGHILWDAEQRFLDVEPIYVVEGNVDYNEGNIIDFVGKVLVKGDVKSKFKVTAEGDIEVQGTVEDAVVKSQHGSVLVAGSVIHKSGGQIQAAKTCHCMIASNAHIKANKIIIDKEAMNSYLEAEKEIEVIGSPGVILGGETHAKELLRVNTIGSESGVATKIHVGDVTQLKQRLRILRQKLMMQEGKLKEAEEIAHILSEREKDSSLSESQEEQLQRARNDIPTLEDALTFAQEEEEAIRAEIIARKPARLEVLKDLFPQVDVFLFEAHMVPESTEKYSGFHCKDGNVKRYAL